MIPQTQSYVMTRLGLQCEVPEKNPCGKKWMTQNDGLKVQLARIYNGMRKNPKNTFRCYVITGKPGYIVGIGKSTLAAQIGYDMDPNFSIKKMCGDITAFNKEMYECEDLSILVFDEGMLGAGSGDSNTKENKLLLNCLGVAARMKKLVILILAPTLQSLSRKILRDYVNGAFVIPKEFNSPSLQEYYYYNGKQLRRYLSDDTIHKIGYIPGRPRSRGCFTSQFPFEKEYLKKKKGNAQKVLHTASLNNLLTVKDAAAQLGYTTDGILMAIKEKRLLARKVTIKGNSLWVIKPKDFDKYKKKVGFSR